MPSDTFVVDVTQRLLSLARRFTPFLIFRVPDTYFLVDTWALGNLLTSALAWLIASPTDWPSWWFALFGYGLWRLYELVVTHMEIILGKYSKQPTPNTIRSARRS